MAASLESVAKGTVAEEATAGKLVSLATTRFELLLHDSIQKEHDQHPTLRCRALQSLLPCVGNSGDA